MEERQAPGGGMKLLILTLMILCAAPAYATDPLAPDKVSHFATGMVWGGLSGTVTYRYAENMGPTGRTLTATALGTVPGLVVEIGDKFSSVNYFSWGDLLADGLGALAGAVTAELVNGQLWVSASGSQVRLVGRW
jgi:hypothetical protein